MKRTNHCQVKFCPGTLTPGCHSPYCAKHRTIFWREKFPAHYAFNNLRHRAKQRGHAFTLTRARFVELWNGGLAAFHGKTGHSLCVDRIKNEQGYSDDNVRLLTLSENSRRQSAPYFRNKAEEAEEIAKTEEQSSQKTEAEREET